MDQLLILLVLFIIGLPITALIVASKASARARRLERRLEELERGHARQTTPAPKPPTHVPEPLAGSATTPPSTSAARSGNPTPPALPPVSEEPAPALRPTAPVTPALARLPRIDWEQFMGAKLFAWIGGLALFLGIAFFVKYAFERELIPPAIRVALGFAAGIGLLGGGFLMDRKRYTITAHTLCATGILALYVTTFACRALYAFPFFGVVPTFLLMALITAVAFLIAVRFDSIVVAVLGLVGGFLTPALLSTDHDYLFSLFAYIALLDLGLVAVALYRRWHFLLPLAALGTIATQWDWFGSHFTIPKAPAGLAVFLFFSALFLTVAYLAGRRGTGSPTPGRDWPARSATALAISALGFALGCIGFHQLATGSPALILAAVLIPGIFLAALSLVRPDRPVFQAMGAGAGFGLLALWLAGRAEHTPQLLPWLLGGCFAFALIHTAFPLVAARLGVARRPWLHALPLLALVLTFFPVATIGPLSLMAWPVIFAITAVVVAASVVARTPWAIAAALVLTLLVLAVWVGSVPPVMESASGLVGIIAVFAVAVSAGLFSLRARMAEGAAPLTGRAEWEKRLNLLTPHLPAASSALPFALLMIVVARLPLASPSPVFGLALVLSGLLLGLAYLLPNHVLPLVGLGCVAALQTLWQTRHLPGAIEAGTAVAPLIWHLVFFAVYALYPFLANRHARANALPWIASALSGPLHFFLVHQHIGAAWPNGFMGLVPALFALPSIAALVVLLKKVPADAPGRTTQLAWFGGVVLLFVTLIFPIQLSREWITLGWALEGAALLWLFHRIPHPGLRLTGLALLVVSFVRLALNPAVLSYHERGELPILNWFLYTYGIAIACLFVGAYLLRGSRHRVLSLNAPAFLCVLGTILAFLLVNIQIADFFAEPGQRTLAFDFSGNLGRDMTYTIAWSLFALGLIAIGLSRRIRPARLAGITLLAVALLKLFSHDLASLEALYRIGALMGTAVIAIFASFLYQKLQSLPEEEDAPTRPTRTLRTLRTLRR